MVGGIVEGRVRVVYDGVGSYGVCRVGVKRDVDGFEGWVGMESGGERVWEYVCGVGVGEE